MECSHPRHCLSLDPIIWLKMTGTFYVTIFVACSRSRFADGLLPWDGGVLVELALSQDGMS